MTVQMTKHRSVLNRISNFLCVALLLAIIAGAIFGSPFNFRKKYEPLGFVDLQVRYKHYLVSNKYQEDDDTYVLCLVNPVTGDEYKSYIEADQAADKAFFQDVKDKLAHIKAKIPQPKKSVMMLHVVKNGESFEVGYYSKFQVNKQADMFLSNESEPIYNTEFCPIQEYSTLEHAEEHVTQENLASLLRNNSIADLKAFQKENAKYENEEMRLMSDEHWRSGNDQ